MSLIQNLCEIRATHPEKITQVLDARPQADLTATDGLAILACDHPARGALGVGNNPLAMASREDLLNRCVIALSNPRINGFLGTPDLVEDLALLGVLDGKVVWGSMNRTGIQGACFEIDDRFSCYDAVGIARSGLNGGKMLLRIDYDDPASALALERCARAVSDLADHHLTSMIEPFICSQRRGRIVNDLSTDAVIRAISIASGLGHTSAKTWLKLPVVNDMERVAESTTLPILILGGDVSQNPEEVHMRRAEALALPNVRGFVFGRSLLYPPDSDVEAAVKQTVELL